MPHRSSAPERTWTTRQLLDWTTAHLEKREVDSPRLAAELLLAHVLEIPRIKLYMDMDRPATPLERAAFRDLIEKAAEHHPVQYLLGQAHFFSLALKVDRHTLIPRPCTEMLIEHVIQHARLTPGLANPLIADIGAGSGCIAVALAKNLPAARLVAVDISGGALSIARENAAKHGVAERIDFRLGSLYEPLTSERFDFIVSNPPYIPDQEWAAVGQNVKNFEPETALRGGTDGMKFLRPLIEQSPQWLKEGGQIVFEIAAAKKQAALEIAAGTSGLKNGRVLSDHQGLPRMLVAERR